MKLQDSYGRKINYLRLSVTDRCNLRCTYCMPTGGISKVTHESILSYEELLQIASAAVEIGIEKIRITGGEPLVRRGIIDFLGRLGSMPGLKQLVLTTNGILLEEMAQQLKDAGVQRLNVSLDSLRPEIFSQVTCGGDVNRVLAGLAAAERVGFPVKVNMVVMRGINDDEIADFARLTIEKKWTVRFIEYMPTLKKEGWSDRLVPGPEIEERLAALFPLKQVDKGELAGPSRDFAIEGARGSLGVITPVSGHFCGGCNRIRVTSGGKVRGCLFAKESLDLRPYLVPERRDELLEALRQVVGEKPEGHGIACGAHEAFNMSDVGG